MSVVNLVSGGLDSTLVALMLKEEGIRQFPLFIDYGQRAAQHEWQTCQAVAERYALPAPVRMDLSGFGTVIRSGLTDDRMDIKLDAFTPGRNLMFLLMGAAYAHQSEAKSVAIGLLSEKYSFFPDQRATFLQMTEALVSVALGRKIKIVAPLFDFSKSDVVELAHQKNVTGTYSCHTGNIAPCGACIACLEFETKGR